MPEDQESDFKSPTRRKFLQNTGSTAVALVIGAHSPANAGATVVDNAAPQTTDGASIAGAIPITLRSNGKDRQNPKNGKSQSTQPHFLYLQYAWKNSLSFAIYLPKKDEKWSMSEKRAPGRWS